MDLKKLNETIKGLFEEKDYETARALGYSDSQDYEIGDRVLVLVNGRVGTVIEKPAADKYKVELDNDKINMPRIDTYYADDLEPYNAEFYESVNEEKDVRTYSITVEVEVPHTMNNIETEEAIESAIQQKYGDMMKVLYIDSNAIL